MCLRRYGLYFMSSRRWEVLRRFCEKRESEGGGHRQSRVREARGWRERRRVGAGRRGGDRAIVTRPGLRDLRANRAASRRKSRLASTKISPATKALSIGFQSGAVGEKIPLIRYGVPPRTSGATRFCGVLARH